MQDKSDIEAEKQSAIQHHKAGRLNEALAAYSNYLAREPLDASIWSNLGALLRQQKLYDQSLRAHARAFALSPRSITVLNNYANILSDLGRYEASIGIRQQILRRNPNDAEQMAILGRCLRGKGQYDAAIDWLEECLEKQPDHPELLLQLAFAQLGKGAYSEGFRNYRARWSGNELTPRDLPWPEWAGENPKGKRVLVLPEQGFGDTMLFARYLPALKQLGATVVLPLERPLRRLFEQTKGIDEIVENAASAGSVDYWVNMMDLPIFCAQDKESIPPPASFGLPEDSLARATKITEPFGDTYKIGVVWNGSITYKGNAFRSFSHKEFLRLTDVNGVQLFSLYKGPDVSAFHQDGSSAFIVDAGSTDRDFADCAAMMRTVDLVITSDTATAHLAGSLGVETWVALHWDPFWVYGHHGDATNWYPSMRLFRQRKPMDWAGVFEQIDKALRARLSNSNEREDG